MSLSFSAGAKATSGVPFHQFGVQLNTTTDTLPPTGLFFPGFGDARKIPDGVASFLFAKSIRIQASWSFAGSSHSCDDEVPVGTSSFRNEDGFTEGTGGVVSVHQLSAKNQGGTFYSYSVKTPTSSGGLVVGLDEGFNGLGNFRPRYYALLDVWDFAGFRISGLNQTFDEDERIDEQFGIGFFADIDAPIVTSISGFGVDWKIPVDNEITISGSITVASSLPVY